MYLKIERLNGDIWRSNEIGFRLKEFVPHSSPVENNFESALGRPGTIDMGAVHGQTTIDVTGDFFAYDAASFPDYRDRLIKQLNTLEAFYLFDSRQPFKRYLVRLDGSIDASQFNASAKGEASFTFVTVFLPYAESYVTSLQPRVFEDEGWSWGANIEWSDEDFVFDSTSFVVPNWGDVPVNPRFVNPYQMDLVIRFSGASTGLTIANLTTGETWQYNESTLVTDNVVISGISAKKNGTSILRDTNLAVLTLTPGDNQFQISGTSGAFTISFEFRFPYL